MSFLRKILKKIKFIHKEKAMHEKKVMPEEKAVSEEKAVPEKPAAVEGIVRLRYPFVTFYSVGPDMLTFSYPVDTAVYKEIYEEGGLIGPEKYHQYPGALDAMKENDNDWFTDKEHEEARNLLVKDLLTLAKKHGKAGAYSLLGSITIRFIDQMKYWEKGISMGCPKCMVASAIMLYRDGRKSEGFALLKRGADAGEKMGCFLVAISYHYGTLSEMDINKACEYYFKALGSDMDFYIFANLGCILEAGGYYFTAVDYFDRMGKAGENIDDDLKRNTEIQFELCLRNRWSCRDLLNMPSTERAKRVRVQIHTRRLTEIFCFGQKVPEPYVPDHVPYSMSGFVPSPELFDIDPEDIKYKKELEKSQALAVKKPVNEAEDFLFLSIPIKIDSPGIYGTQREVLFLEKYCHAELNNYIYANLIPLRAMFKSIGYILTYLPAHLDDMEVFKDRMGSYYNDYGDTNLSIRLSLNHDAIRESRAQEYWEAMVPSQMLPDDCAGFLMYKHNPDNLDDHTNFEYILFPYRPDTDWPRAFREFFALLRGRTIVPVYDREEPLPLLPKFNHLHISANHRFTLRDNCDKELAEIKMPTLSKVVYLALLNHPEGIAIKKLPEYKDELWKYYKAMAGSKAKIENIEVLCDPTNNSINEKLSRIKKAFASAMEEKDADDMANFIPTGKRGEAISLSVDRDRVKYEQTNLVT